MAMAAMLQGCLLFIQDDESALEGLVNAGDPQIPPTKSPSRHGACLTLAICSGWPEDRLSPRITRLFGRLLEDLALLPFWEGQARHFWKLE